jgi:PPOX class probable F420-dependent enzyme
MPVIPSGAFGDRVRTRLRDERVVWLTTVGADGTPQPNPVWFLWEDPATVLVYNRRDAFRLAHIARRPRVALNFDGDGTGSDIVVLTGSARVVDDRPGPDSHPAYLAKYDAAMRRVSGSIATFAADYPVPMEITVERVRGF